MKNIKILIITPNKPEQIISLVEQSKYSTPEVDIALTVAKGIEYVSKNKYDIILLDPVLPNGQGIHVYDQIHSKCGPTPIIVISDNEAMVSELIKAGAYDNHLRTDLTERLLNKSIQYAIKRSDVEYKLRKEKNSNKKLYDTLNVIFNCATDIIWSKNSDNRFDIVNKTFLATINMKESDIIGKTVDEILINDNVDAANSDKIVRETQEPYKGVARVFLNDGKLLWWDVIKSPVFNDAGNLIGMVATARDITEKVEAEERIRIQLDSKILDWKKEQDRNMTEIRESIADTVKQIDGFKETLDEYSRQ